MSTVTVDIDLDVVFDSGALLSLDVAAPFDLFGLQTLDELLDVLTFTVPDIGPLTSLWGPVTGISWTITAGVDPALIPIGAAGWLMLSALAVLGWVARK